MFEIFPNLLKIENQEITFMLCSQPFLTVDPASSLFKYDATYFHSFVFAVLHPSSDWMETCEEIHKSHLSNRNKTRVL